MIIHDKKKWVLGAVIAVAVIAAVVVAVHFFLNRKKPVNDYVAPPVPTITKTAPVTQTVKRKK